MRTFIIMLLLANLAYLAWSISNSPASSAVMVRQPSRQAVRTLQLLSEVIPEEAPVPETPLTCLSLGVFNNTNESDFLVSALLERGMQASAELLPSGEILNYRLYMPAFNSATATQQTLEALQENEVESFVINSGDLAGAISLGLFTEEDRALDLQEALAAQGFPTSIEEITRANNEIWVTIEGLSQALLEGSQLLDLLAEGLELEVIEKPCETFASGP